MRATNIGRIRWTVWTLGLASLGLIVLAVFAASSADPSVVIRMPGSGSASALEEAAGTLEAEDTVPDPGTAGKSDSVTTRAARSSACPYPTIVGTDGRDVLVGTLGDDIIDGRGGDDSIFGLDGDDLICGGGGSDTIRGGRGHDTVFAEEGNDLILGQDGSDTLDGGAGDDSLVGGRGIPYRDDGNDVLAGRQGDDFLFGGTGSDELDGGPGDDRCLRGPVAVNCELNTPGAAHEEGGGGRSEASLPGV